MKNISDKINEGFFSNTGAHNDPEYIFQSIIDDCKGIIKELDIHDPKDPKLKKPTIIKDYIRTHKYIMDKFKSLPADSVIYIESMRKMKYYKRVDNNYNFGGYYFVDVKSPEQNVYTARSAEIGIGTIMIRLITCILSGGKFNFKENQ